MTLQPVERVGARRARRDLRQPRLHREELAERVSERVGLHVAGSGALDHGRDRGAHQRLQEQPMFLLVTSHLEVALGAEERLHPTRAETLQTPGRDAATDHVLRRVLHVERALDELRRATGVP
jgi:hypothetical protein